EHAAVGVHCVGLERLLLGAAGVLAEKIRRIVRGALLLLGRGVCRAREDERGRREQQRRRSKARETACPPQRGGSSSTAVRARQTAPGDGQRGFHVSEKIRDPQPIIDLKRSNR